VRDFNNPMRSRLCLKVDLQKAFDNVNREFIYYMMHCMGFSCKWISWIRACLKSPSFLIMLNGSPTGFFTSNKGIRKGDPLSPYLFVIVMEFWSIKMQLAITSRQIQPLKREQQDVTHLLFADDMLVFCKGNKNSVSALNSLLEDLFLNTGLEINKQKSKYF